MCVCVCVCVHKNESTIIQTFDKKQRKETDKVV